MTLETAIYIILWHGIIGVLATFWLVAVTAYGYHGYSRERRARYHGTLDVVTYGVILPCYVVFLLGVAFLANIL